MENNTGCVIWILFALFAIMFVSCNGCASNKKNRCS